MNPQEQHARKICNDFLALYDKNLDKLITPDEIVDGMKAQGFSERDGRIFSNWVFREWDTDCSKTLTLREVRQMAREWAGLSPCALSNENCS